MLQIGKPYMLLGTHYNISNHIPISSYSGPDTQALLEWLAKLHIEASKSHSPRSGKPQSAVFIRGNHEFMNLYGMFSCLEFP